MPDPCTSYELTLRFPGGEITIRPNDDGGVTTSIRADFSSGAETGEAGRTVQAMVEQMAKSTLGMFGRAVAPRQFDQWFVERMVIDPKARVAAFDLYQDYVAWAVARASEPMSQRSFGGALTDRGVGLGSKDRYGRITRIGARLAGLEDVGAASEGAVVRLADHAGARP